MAVLEELMDELYDAYDGPEGDSGGQARIINALAWVIAEQKHRNEERLLAYRDKLEASREVSR